MPRSSFSPSTWDMAASCRPTSVISALTAGRIDAHSRISWRSSRASSAGPPTVNSSLILRESGGPGRATERPLSHAFLSPPLPWRIPAPPPDIGRHGGGRDQEEEQDLVLRKRWDGGRDAEHGDGAEDNEGAEPKSVSGHRDELPECGGLRCRVWTCDLLASRDVLRPRPEGWPNEHRSHGGQYAGGQKV